MGYREILYLDINKNYVVKRYSAICFATTFIVGLLLSLFSEPVLVIVVSLFCIIIEVPLIIYDSKKNFFFNDKILMNDGGFNKIPFFDCANLSKFYLHNQSVFEKRNKVFRLELFDLEDDKNNSRGLIIHGIKIESKEVILNYLKKQCPKLFPKN